MQSENVLMCTWIFHSYSNNRLLISNALAETLPELWLFLILKEPSILRLIPISGRDLTVCFLYEKCVSSPIIMVQLGGFWPPACPRSIYCLLPVFQDTFSRFLLKSAEYMFSESSSASELVGEIHIFHLQLTVWFALHQKATSPLSQRKDSFHWLRQKLLSSLFADLGLRTSVSLPGANEGSDRYRIILPTLTCTLRPQTAFFSIALYFYLLFQLQVWHQVTYLYNAVELSKSLFLHIVSKIPPQFHLPPSCHLFSGGLHQSHQMWALKSSAGHDPFI